VHQFVHGALSVFYSIQCKMQMLIGPGFDPGIPALFTDYYLGITNDFVMQEVAFFNHIHYLPLHLF